MGRKTITKSSACATVAKDLREFGYPDATAEMIREVLNAWLSGKRELDLPHGIVGAIAGRQFNEIEQERPGVLARLP